jgi:hypothetical protein
MLYVFLEALAQTLGVSVLEDEGRKGVSQSVISVELNSLCGDLRFLFERG